jgi:cell division protein FtsB
MPASTTVTVSVFLILSYPHAVMKGKAMRYLFPVLIVVFIIASSLIFFFGDSGLTAYGNLDRYREKLAANVEDLHQRNIVLSADLDSLRKGTERAVVLARGIGLYRSGEEVVKLEGRPARGEPTAIGNLVKLRKPAEARNSVVKSAAMGISAILLAYAGISIRRSRRRAHDTQGG